MPLNHPVSRAATIRKLQKLAKFLDSGISVPGTNARFGMDAVIGLVPGIGDVVTTGMSAYVVVQGVRLGASGKTVAMMVGNVAIDFVAGSIPALGDIADFFFKSNQRNLLLLAKDPNLAAEFEALGGIPQPTSQMANFADMTGGMGTRRVVNEAA